MAGAPAECGPNDQTNRLFVGNLNRETDAAALTAALGVLGEEVLDSRVVSNFKNGRSKGYGFVTFGTIGSATAALAASGSIPVCLDGHTLQIKSCAKPSRLSTLEESDQALVGERVPCPYDASHTVPYVRLQRHLLVCHARPVEAQWRRVGVNTTALALGSGSPVDLDAATGSNAPAPSECTDEELEALLGLLNHAVAAILLENQNHSATDHCQDAEFKMEDPLPATFAEFVSTAPLRKTNPESFKHRRQIASILGHLSQLGALPEESAGPGAAAFVDFGAGSGFLTGALFEGFPAAMQGATCFMIDRSSAPHRRSKSNEQCVRVKCDLADFWLAGIEPSAPAPCRWTDPFIAV